MVKVADEVWIATAMLHREFPGRQSFKVGEIVGRAAREKLHHPLRPGVQVHVSLHCVANKPPNPGTYRMLYATGDGQRRLFRSGDDAHPARTGKITPDPADLPAAYLPLLDWYQSSYSPAPDPAVGLPSIPDLEGLVQQQTQSTFGRSLDLLVRVLNTYLEGFRRLNRYTLAEDRDPRVLILALVSRSFNSAWCAYGLITRGHYQQAIALARMIDEDWVTTRDIAFNEETRAALWSKKRPRRSFADMAAEIGEDTRQWWESVYGPASEVAHPRGLAIFTQFESFDLTQLRVGPIYSETLGLMSFWHTINAAQRMLHVLLGCFSVGLDDEMTVLGRDISTWRTWAVEFMGDSAMEGDELPPPGPAVADDPISRASNRVR